MRPMGLQAVYRVPCTNDPYPEHRVDPYLLRTGRAENQDLTGRGRSTRHDTDRRCILDVYRIDRQFDDK